LISIIQFSSSSIHNIASDVIIDLHNKQLDHLINFSNMAQPPVSVMIKLFKLSKKADIVVELLSEILENRKTIKIESTTPLINEIRDLRDKFVNKHLNENKEEFVQSLSIILGINGKSFAIRNGEGGVTGYSLFCTHRRPGFTKCWDHISDCFKTEWCFFDMKAELELSDCQLVTEYIFPNEKEGCPSSIISGVSHWPPKYIHTQPIEPCKLIYSFSPEYLPAPMGAARPMISWGQYEVVRPAHSEHRNAQISSHSYGVPLNPHCHNQKEPGILWDSVVCKCEYTQTIGPACGWPNNFKTSDYLKMFDFDKFRAESLIDKWNSCK